MAGTLKMKISLYLLFLLVLLILSVLLVVWLNTSYFLGTGYRVFAILILPTVAVFKMTVYSFSSLSSGERIFSGVLIGLIWIAAAGISAYYILLNTHGA